MFNITHQPHQVKAPSPMMQPPGISARPRQTPQSRNSMQDVYAQRALMSLALERQRMLANVLRGAGSVQPPPNTGAITRPQGIPMVK